MSDIGADNSAIKHFINHIENGSHWTMALRSTRQKFSYIHQNSLDFVESTLRLSTEGKTHEIAASFLYGREDQISSMFQ